MIIATHGAAAVVVGQLINKKFDGNKHLGYKDIAGMFLAGILPDIPLSIWMALGQFDPSRDYHHRWITHTPFFWLLFSTIVYFLISKKFAGIISLGALLHLSMDWYGGADGIPFLFPFSAQQFGVLVTGINGLEGFTKYITNPIFLSIEITVNTIFVLYMIKNIQTWITKPHN